MKIRPILGYNCYRAYQVYRDIILASYIFWNANKVYLSDNGDKPESYKDFLMRFEKSTDEEKRDIIKLGADTFNLSLEEVCFLVGLVEDANGVPYSKANINNLQPQEIIDIIIAVCLEISKVTVFF